MRTLLRATFSILINLVQASPLERIGTNGGVAGVSTQECTEIVRRARQYLRVVRNAADNRDLDHDLSRLEGELRKNAHGEVFDLAQFRKEQRTKLVRGVAAGPSPTIGATRGRLEGFLRDIGLFAFFVCLLCSVCSLASLF